VQIPDHTHSITIPAHNHDIDYGITDDSETPDTIRVYINGSDKTTELGGPWNVSGGTTEFNIEISDILKSGTLQQKHTVDFRCDSGQGELEVEVVMTTQQSTVAAT
jgi:hypothetical protein